MNSIETGDRPVIGLFGTCGASDWRDNFIREYRQRGIRFFNPNKPDWNPADAENEARHLIEDDIVLFPILKSELGIASLAETAFSVLRAITERQARFTIIMLENIDPALAERFGKDAVKASAQARSIVRAHLAAQEHSHVYLVDTLGHMLAASIRLHQAATIIQDAKRIACGKV